MEDLQLQLIEALAQSGISETVLLFVATVIKGEEVTVEFLDRLLEAEEDGLEMCDQTVTEVVLEMIREARQINSSMLNDTSFLPNRSTNEAQRFCGGFSEAYIRKKYPDYRITVDSKQKENATKEKEKKKK